MEDKIIIDWFGGTMTLVVFTIIAVVFGWLIFSDENRSLQPVGVFQLGEKASTLDCDQRTDCPSPMVTPEDVANGYVRQ